ncbi:mRNA cap guanine-N7 methyltransferase [Culex pipiens pallens]|uniref:mRNA cap guanine-N7 methyltransferase n=1 Tax=Culex pipiens pallens TaxID=42434 RepID=UPI0019547578|nr:mRNA cap guanine-N7 methyltransferase [Culex pipiens pallens]
MAEVEHNETICAAEPRLSEDEEDQQPETASSSEVLPVEERASTKRPHSDEEEDDGEPSATVLSKDPQHTTVVASHYNQLKERGLYERSKSRIFYMRNFNNWIKSILINRYLNKIREKAALGTPLRVMDMCCGKGGDLLKWSKGNITHLICTDIAAVSVEQCETRYNNIIQNDRGSGGGGRNSGQSGSTGKVFTAEFFAADATLQRLREKYRDASVELNLVSCQFAFHYCFESLRQAEFMLKNAAECLREGGYFIGTIPDANEIMKRQRAAGSDTFGNDVYKITFLCDTEQPPLFGAKYNFQLDGVVDCPEFLVHFPTLTKLALKYGLRLVEKQRFDEFYSESVQSGRGLIEKMQALETFPGQSRDERERQQNLGEYSHAQGHLDQKGAGGGGRFQKVGTLSKSEWEASTLYMFFAFQKMKTNWDKNGKPIYS